MSNGDKHSPLNLPAIRYEKPEDVVARAKAAIGVSMLNMDKSEGHWRLNPDNKGAVGQILEESWFRYAPNGSPTADFAEFGLELKSFAYLVNKKGEKVAKERLSGNIIDYMEDYKNGFYESSFLKKCRRMVLMTYEYRPHPADVVISGAARFDLPPDLLQDLEKDYYCIIDKIKDGKAHEIHGSDTDFLEAMTKGSTAAGSMRKQPFSPELAKQRAFALKTNVVTRIIQDVIFAEHILPDSSASDGPVPVEAPVSGLNVEKSATTVSDSEVLHPAAVATAVYTNAEFEESLLARVAPYVGLTRSRLIRELKLESSSAAKSINELIFNRMLGVRKASKTSEFLSRRYLPKTIRINKKGGITESMVFRSFDFRSVARGEWENSMFCRELTSRFVFPIFEEQNNGDYIFRGIYFWSMPRQDLLEAQRVWELTKDLLNNGLEIWDDGNITRNNLPAMKDSPIAHVRPHTQHKTDVCVVPDGSGRVLTKQAFWLRNIYVLKQVKSLMGRA